MTTTTCSRPPPDGVDRPGSGLAHVAAGYTDAMTIDMERLAAALVGGVLTGRICAEVFGGHDVATVSGTLNGVPLGRWPTAPAPA